MPAPSCDAFATEVAAARIRIEQVIDRLLRDRQATRWLQYPQATFHEDRLVLPLAAEHRGRVPGIIHRSSESGATLFVEPAEAVELNNLIIALKNDETIEINRLLWHLTHQVQLNRDEILRTMDALAVLDLVAAKVKLAWTYKLVCPIISTDGKLRLHDARHRCSLICRKRLPRPASERISSAISLRAIATI
jgi:DNA mismatch repair protein MutS2